MLALGGHKAPEERQDPPGPGADMVGTKARIGDIVSRWPAVGLAVGVIRQGRLEFYTHGVADIRSGTPITEDTVFRVASLTKLFTAVAVMQLCEQGLVDLDAPANDYLRAFRLVPTESRFPPATVRHLLTHTAGVPEVMYVRDLFHPNWGMFQARPAVRSVKMGDRMPTLAEYYGRGPRVDVPPGTAFAYTNHGFAALGQIVEDVTAEPLDSYFREHLFEPLGMVDSRFLPTEAMRSRIATGYELFTGGAKAVLDRDWVTRGASGLYSTPRDISRFVRALLAGGTNEWSSILKPATLGSMFEPHYQPDRRLSGMGLGFFRHDAGGHRVVGHDGRLPGFNAELLVAPDDDVGIFAFTNGSSRAMFWMPTELGRLLHELIGVAADGIRSDIPQHPEVWADLCGRYGARTIDLRGRLMMGGGVEVVVRGGRLVIRLLTPMPAAWQGTALFPDDAADPDVFRIDLSHFGMGTARVVFSRDRGRPATALHTDVGLLSFQKRQPVKYLARSLARGVAVTEGKGQG
jgi:CubicO group peptidase (beta-lactamase class C family)